MADVVSSVVSAVVHELIIRALETVKKFLLNVKDEKVIPEDKQLKFGDELCGERTVPMSPQLINKVKRIYKNCHTGNNGQRDTPLIKGRSLDILGVKRTPDSSRDPVRKSKKDDTPLMKALKVGLMNMVWGLIECAKQTNSNLLTDETGDVAVQQFLWLSNEWTGETAFDVAIAKNQLGVASLLLNQASLSHIESELNQRGKTLLPLLNNDPIYDAIIFQILEKEKPRELLNPPTSHQIHDDSRQESIFDIESVKNLNSYPESQPERNKTREALRNLDHDLLGLNPSKNSILHLASVFGDVKYAKEILESNPSRICCRNSNGETPAYVAAREGHADILKVVFQYIKRESEDIESIVTRGVDKHNALHIAIQNHHVEVVFFLIEELPQLANRINNYNESPLYLAAERKYSDVLNLILKKCKEIAVVGPNGKTALHAAAISDSRECIKYLLNERRDLLNVKDKNDLTPFRCAVYHNSSLATEELLNVDNSIGYELMTEDDINTSAIHIAASRGHYEIMKVLMSKCPGCLEFIDTKGRNILHVAVENKKNRVIKGIFQDKSLTSLINQKDNNGNTPVHLLMASDFEMMEKVMDYRVDINVLNNKEKTPLDKTSSDNQRERLTKRIAMGISIHNENTLSDNTSKYHHKEKEYEDEEKELEAKRKEAEARFKIAENLVVVAALISTASFAAGITLPGGLHSDDGSKQGTPFLLRKAAFRAFIVTDALAFSCSCTILLIYVALLMYRSQYVEASSADQKYINERILAMYYLTAIALFMMEIAFVTGVYVVLTPSLVLAIFACVLSVLTIGLGVRLSIASDGSKSDEY